MNNKVLLIGGGGTLGTYTAKELLNAGHAVDIICLDDRTSETEGLRFFQGEATAGYLADFLKDKMYDGIVNFIHYPEVEEYPPVHEILISHTKHLIVLSSYRVYADRQHPVTETAPMLLDVSTDREFIETEKYAISKAKLEKYLNAHCKGQPWTVVRPVISFSKDRFDLLMHSRHKLIDLTEQHEVIPLPAEAKDITAGLDWAGNSGKLIAALLFKEKTYGEAYTVSSAQNLTWDEVASLYTEQIGARFRWVPAEEYIKTLKKSLHYALLYDRLFDRRIDNSKILSATGLRPGDFLPIQSGLEIELERYRREHRE